MKAVELIGEVNDKHQLQAQVPETLPPGRVRIIVLIPEEDEVGPVWLQGIAQEWEAELGDPREDLYTLEDGKPVDATR
ncbi:MAG: hypothetical protein HY268_22245 [Deltaproteobacteria bacterium]|nr:hypothetical protein [Deltaproteobacteria bacterium]